MSVEPKSAAPTISAVIITMPTQQAIQALLNKRDLTAEQMREVMRTVMSGNATDAQLAGFLIALRCKAV
jgi:anthranilate phosphoribosyltransferase